MPNFEVNKKVVLFFSDLEKTFTKRKEMSEEEYAANISSFVQDLNALKNRFHAHQLLFSFVTHVSSLDTLERYLNLVSTLNQSISLGKQFYWCHEFDPETRVVLESPLSKTKQMRDYITSLLENKVEVTHIFYADDALNYILETKDKNLQMDYYDYYLQELNGSIPVTLILPGASFNFSSSKISSSTKEAIEGLDEGVQNILSNVEIIPNHLPRLVKDK